MNDAVKYFQKNGLQRSRELVEMGFGFCSLEDGLHTYPHIHIRRD